MSEDIIYDLMGDMDRHTASEDRAYEKQMGYLPHTGFTGTRQPQAERKHGEVIALGYYDQITAKQLHRVFKYKDRCPEVMGCELHRLSVKGAARFEALMEQI